ncbi:heavy-metal-associated domain-containing protein [Sphingomonas sp.]|uniref:heavy-metal-associated domain-containing protein n=1 Tax=Sphingomonas sp. TaxID=28214 RepID=UPI0025CFE090|nr:heavy-metal-associated domain-containing protein [Sphingomonas sp.]MBV9528480.1 heavy-metal-associated domain-containing protein [Sphingomonas sp.]
MISRHLAVPLSLLLAAVTVSAVVYGQLETGDRGILPLDSSGTLEVSGIHVDVGAADAQSARFAGWRIAQRQGFRVLWAKMHNAPLAQAPNLPDGTLDQIVSSVNVEREQLGPNRYIADLGVQFDRARAAAFLGVEGGQVQRTAPMLLVPILVTGGTETSVELRNAWQKAWAQYRTSTSPIDYVRVSGLGADPLLVNAALTTRPGRGWWRNLLDLYGASDVLVAEVQLQRLYPGGPARARFIAMHGPDREIVGGFTLTSNSGDVQGLMAEGVRRTDELFGQALSAGRLMRDTSLDLPPPPVLPEQPIAAQPVAAKPASTGTAIQVQISANGDVNVYNFAMAHLRTMPGVASATPQLISPTGTSYVLVSYHGDIAGLAAALSGRGWAVDFAGTVVHVHSAGNKPPPLPPPPPPATAAEPQPAAQPTGQHP